MESRTLPGGRRTSEHRHLDDPTDVRFGRLEPKRLLPIRSGPSAGGPGYGPARRDSTNCSGVAFLRKASYHSRTEAARLDGGVQRLMREDNLLCLRKRKFTATTDSRHTFRVYQNLAGKMKLNAINQLWTADITCIRLATEFVYLARRRSLSGR